MRLVSQQLPSRISQQAAGIGVFVCCLSVFTEGRSELIVFFYLGYVMLVGSVLIARLFDGRKLYVSSYTKCYALFVAFAFLNHMLFSIDRSHSLAMLLRLAVIGVLFWCVYNAVYMYRVDRYLCLGFAAALLINVLILIGIVPVGFETHFKGRFQGTVGNANVYANMIVAALVVIAGHAHRIRAYSVPFFVVLLSGSVCVLFSGSRAGILMLMVLVAYIVWQLGWKMGLHLLPTSRSGKRTVEWLPLQRGAKRFGQHVLLVLAVIGIALFLKTTVLGDTFRGQTDAFHERMSGFVEFMQGGEGDSSTRHRYRYVEESLAVFAERPLAGVGIDNFKLLSFKSYAHNNYLELLADLGLFGCLIYYLGLFVLGRKILASRHEARALFLMFLALRLLGDLTIVSYYLRAVFIALAFIEAVVDREADGETETLGLTPVLQNLDRV